MDPAAVIAQVEGAFRPAAVGFTGGVGAYRSAAVDGRLEVTAVTGAADPFRLETTAIGGAPVDGEIALDADASVVIDRGAAVERWRNVAAGVEQTWELATAPAGGGSFVVELAVSGFTFAGAADDGLHFASARGGAMRYGHGTWVDADGQRSPVPARWTGASIVLEVPSAVIARSRFPAVLDPIISVETAFDIPGAGASVHGTQSSYAAHQVNGTWVIAWTDERAEGAQLIVGTALDGSGNPVHPYGKVLLSCAYCLYLRASTALATDGTYLAVTWVSAGDNKVWLRRFDSALAPVGGDVLVNDVAAEKYDVAVAYEGGHYLVAWTDKRSGNWDIRGARVTAGGSLADDVSDGISISTASADQMSPDVAGGAGYFLVGWRDARNLATSAYDIYAARVAASSGTVEETDGIPICRASSSQGDLDIAFQQNFMVVWSDPRNQATTGSDVYGARVVAATGGAPDGDGFPITTAASEQFAPRLAAGGTGGNATMLATWIDYGSPTYARGGRVDAVNGTALDPNGFALSSGAQYLNGPGVGGGATQFVIAAGAGTYYDPASLVLPATTGTMSVPSTATPINIAGNAQLPPGLGSNGAGHLIAYLDQGSSLKLRVARISAAGVASTSVVLVQDASNGWTVNPGVTPRVVAGASGASYLVLFGGSHYVAPTYENGLFAQRVDATTGAAVGSAFLVDSSSYASGGVLTGNGTDWFAAWVDYNFATSRYQVHGRRISSTGALLGARLDLGVVAASMSPSVGYANGVYLTAWHDNRNGSSGDIYATRVDASSGALPDGTGFLVSSVDRPVSAVAAAGSTFIVTTDGEAHRVSTAGVVDPVPISTPAFDLDAGSRWATATSGPTEVLLVWVDRESLALVGQRIHEDGTVADPTPFTIASGFLSTYEERVSADVLADGTFGVSYTRLDTTATVMVPRTYFRKISFEPVGDTCASSSECASGFCVDDRCCDHSCACGVCSNAAGAGTDGICVAAIAATGQVCRSVADLCDVEETCVSGDGDCPEDSYEPTTTVCRDSVADCDAAERCIGDRPTCPADVDEPDGTPCDETPCAVGELCAEGACVGGTPSVTFTPDPVTFARTYVGESSTQAVVVSNVETVSQTVAELATTSEFPASALVLPTTIAAGGSATFDVVFTPADAGDRVATIELTTDDCTFTVDADGEAQVGALSVTPSDGAFGDIDLDDAAVQHFYVITNVGTTPATITATSMETGDAFTTGVVPPTTLPATLAPDASITVTVDAHPTSVGIVDDALVVAFTPEDGPDRTLRLAVTATGVCADCPTPDAGVAPDASVTLDAGVDPAEDDGGGCCSGGRGSTTGSFALAVLLGLVLRRRPKRASAAS